MSRIARAVVPEVPHHVTQRGNRRLQTFFCDEDYEAYIDLMSQWCTHWNVEVWAYCLMPNHIHLIAVPPSEKALSPTFAIRGVYNPLSQENQGVM
ncbi:MAG: hypothetical protein HCAMLNBO_02533 [Candidatus Brocadia fulgida]|nr:hypothetical protein [Candidatus Brocadia fulgida]